MTSMTTNPSRKSEESDQTASPSRRRAALGLLALALSVPMAAHAAPPRRHLRRRVRRRVRRRARFVRRHGRRLLLLAAVPVAGEVLVLDDGREAIVHEIRGTEMLVAVDGDIESVAFEIER